MGSFVVDKSLDVLLRQINEMAPGRSKSSDGSIGDAAHASRDSAHNPQDTSDSSDGNDPDNQVDARDFTHDPAHGADMHKITEAIRASRDRRVHLVIFDGRQFSGYAKNGIPAFTWRPYTGTNMHRHHAHVETNDLFNDDPTPWRIGTDMGIKEDLTVDAIPNRPWRHDAKTNPTVQYQYWIVDLWDRTYRAEASAAAAVTALAELKGMLKVQGEQLLALMQRVDALTIPAPAPVDPAVLQPVVESSVRAVLRDGLDHA